jgi:RNA-directed DNA polymerase
MLGSSRSADWRSLETPSAAKPEARLRRAGSVRSWSPNAANAPASASRHQVSVALEHAAAALARGLPPVLTLGHLAASANVEYSVAREIVQRRHQRGFYTVFNIRKRSGGLREIAVPSHDLLLLQRWIDRSILCSVPVHAAAHAFVKGRGIKTMASVHCGCRLLIKVDVRNFFGSLGEASAFAFFRQQGYSALVAFELARICTYVPGYGQESEDLIDDRGNDDLPYPPGPQGVLPQGGASSPSLSNHLVRALDEDLFRRAASQGLLYSRYSDDLAFSARSPGFPGGHIAAFIRQVHRALNVHGLRVNHRKTRVAGPGARRSVVGLLVDGPQPRLTIRFRQSLQCHLHHIERAGLLAHARVRGFTTAFGLFRYLQGLIAFATDIEPEDGQRMRRLLYSIAAKEIQL